MRLDNRLLARDQHKLTGMYADLDEAAVQTRAYTKLLFHERLCRKAGQSAFCPELHNRIAKLFSRVSGGWTICHAGATCEARLHVDSHLSAGALSI